MDHREKEGLKCRIGRTNGRLGSLDGKMEFFCLGFAPIHSFSLALFHGNCLRHLGLSMGKSNRHCLRGDICDLVFCERPGFGTVDFSKSPAHQTQDLMEPHSSSTGYSNCTINSSFPSFSM